MRIYSRCITLGATAGLLILGGASVVTAQEQQPRDSFTETGAVTDTAAMPGAITDTSMTGVSSDTGLTGMKADTALKAKPAVQTGPARGDSSKVGATDTTAPPSGNVEKKGAERYRHTGAPSDTALHARPGTQTGKTLGDSTTAKPDSTR
jgi:hypothetical protein